MQIGNLKLGAGEGEGTAPDRQQEPHKLEKSEKQRNNTPGAKKDPAKKKNKKMGIPTRNICIARICTEKGLCYCVDI